MRDSDRPNESWALYSWNGSATQDAVFNRGLPDTDLLTGGAWEGLVAVPHPLQAGAAVRLVADSGDVNFYGTGQTKDLAQPYQKSYSQLFLLDAVPPTEDRVFEDRFEASDSR